ncbi:hypothetical protein ACFL2R_00390 [Patescibacteria group bacterium]
MLSDIDNAIRYCGVMVFGWIEAKSERNCFFWAYFFNLLSFWIIGWAMLSGGLSPDIVLLILEVIVFFMQLDWISKREKFIRMEKSPENEHTWSVCIKISRAYRKMLLVIGIVVFFVSGFSDVLAAGFCKIACLYTMSAKDDFLVSMDETVE